MTSLATTHPKRLHKAMHEEYEENALDNDAIVQYTLPYQLSTPQDILPLDENTPFLMLMCTTKYRLDVMLSALLDWSYYANVPETYEHNVDIINALANVYTIENMDCGTMDLCDLIEACLIEAASGENQSLADVINQIIQNNSSSSIDVDSTTQYDIRYTNGSQPISEVSLDDGMGGCDLDVLWGACLEVAERMAQMGLDILETYTASADKIQKIANLSSAIPFVGDIANSLLLAAADIAQDIENAYVAYQTQAIIENVACDLFCMVQAECRYPTFDELLDYYGSGGDTSLNEILSLTYTQLYAQIFSTILGNPIVWYGVQTFALATLYLDGVVLGNEGTKTISLWADIGASNSSNTHETLCDCPVGAICYEYDFTASQQTWAATLNSDSDIPDGVRPTAATEPAATYNTGWDAVQFQQVTSAQVTSACIIKRDISDITINRIEIDCDFERGASSTGASYGLTIRSQLDAGAWGTIANVNKQDIPNQDGQTIAIDLVGNEKTFDALIVGLRCDEGSITEGYATINRIRIYPTSGVPADASAC
jgi:hypothetical protein